jgi:hypothetical protein
MLARYVPPDMAITNVSMTEAARAISNSVGKRIGLLVVSYRPPTIRLTTVTRSGLDRPPTVTDPKLALLIARERHNGELRMAA